jgi:curved DNA-binding protein CbpA
MNLEDSLKVFGLPNLEGQTETTLKKRYHLLAQKYHPDKGGSTKDFIALRRAYIYLRTHLIDPSKQSQSQNRKYSKEQQYYENSSSSSSYKSTDTSQSRSNKTEQPSHEEALRYKEAYEKAIDQIKQYEHILNSQVEIVNRTNKIIDKKYSNYSVVRDSLKKQLDERLATLEKQYNRSWWQYMIPVPKISRDEYIQSYNNLVGSYNNEIKNIDQEYVNGILETYQLSFQQIIEYLK